LSSGHSHSFRNCFRGQAVTWFMVLAGAAAPGSSWGDVVAPEGGPAVNTEARGRERREPVPAVFLDADRIPVIEAKRVKVLRGQTITVVLDSVADGPARRVKFVIRDEPQAGTLSPMRESPEDWSVASVDYTADLAAEVATDRFTFAAQYPQGRVSAPVAVEIELVSPAPVIEAPEALDFGSVSPGDSSQRTLRLKNIGTADYLFGDPLPPPWAWAEGPADGGWTVRPGEALEVQVVYRPEDTGRQSFRLLLPTGIREHPGVLFTGRSALPFELGTEGLVLEFDPASRNRIGRLAVRHQGAAGFPLQVDTVGEGLQSWRGNRVWLENGETQELVFQLGPQDPGAFDGTVVLGFGTYHKVVRVLASPVPGHLKVMVGSGENAADFGEVVAGSRKEIPITLRNEGGILVPVRVLAPAEPFRLEPLPADVPLLLEPGQEVTMTAWLEPTGPGLWRSQVMLSSPERQLSVLLRGTGLALPPTTDPTASAVASGMDGSSGIGNGTSRQSPGPSSGRDSGGKPSAMATRGRGGVAEDYSDLFAARGGQGNGLDPGEVAQGRNGEIELPLLPAADGLLCHSPFRNRTDVELAVPERPRALEAMTRKVHLAWPLPKPDGEGFEVETRGIVYNAQQHRMEGVWHPWRKVRFRPEGGVMNAEIVGLSPGSQYWFRVVSTRPDGTHSLPSRELLVRTVPLALGLNLAVNGGVGLLLLLGGGGMVWYFRREQNG